MFCILPPKKIPSPTTSSSSVGPLGEKIGPVFCSTEVSKVIKTGDLSQLSIEVYDASRGKMLGNIFDYWWELRPTSLLEFRFFWWFSGFLDLRGRLLLPRICLLIVFDKTFLTVFRGQFLLAKTTKTSGTLFASSSFRTLLSAGKRNIFTKSKTTCLVTAVNAPIPLQQSSAVAEKTGKNSCLPW